MKIFFTFCLIFICFLMQAQEQKKQELNTLTVAINGEQMLEKMGFEHLMSLMFDASKKRNIEKNKTIRKALAAIYGSGIDFKRKVWITYKEKVYENKIWNRPWDEDREESFPLIYIPVSNKQVFVQSIQNMITEMDKDYYNGSMEKKETKTIESGNTTTIITRESIFVFSDKDLVITGMPGFYSGYDYYKGKTIKTDTVFVEKKYGNIDFGDKVVINPDIEGSKEDNFKKEIKEPVVIIDQIDKNGNIKRLYKTKKAIRKVDEDDRKAETVNAYPEIAPPDIAVKDLVLPSMAMDSAVAAPATTTELLALKDAMESIKGNPSNFNKIADTLKRTEYLNDSTELQIWYVEYTQKEIDSIIKAKDEARFVKKERYITDFVAGLGNFNPYSILNADMTKIIEAKEDIAMYIHSNFGSSFGIYNPMMRLRTIAGTMDNNMDMAYLGFINFENGKATLKAQSSCCSGTNNMINNMYFPVTDFWPNALGVNNLASMRYHLNVKELIKYYQNMFPSEMEIEKKMAEEGFSFKEIGEIFEGEVALTVGVVKKNEYGRKEPKLMLALKLKDAAKAVDMMNRVTNKSVEIAPYYRFDEKGKYLLVCSEQSELEQWVKTPVAKTIEKESLSTGHFGEVKVNLKGLIDALTRDSQKKQPMFLLTKNFFNKLDAVNSKTEDGNFIGDMNMDMGDKNKNALYNLIQLFKEINEAEIKREEMREKEYESRKEVDWNKEVQTNKKRTVTKRTAVKKKN